MQMHARGPSIRTLHALSSPREQPAVDCAAHTRAGARARSSTNTSRQRTRPLRTSACGVSCVSIPRHETTCARLRAVGEVWVIASPSASAPIPAGSRARRAARELSCNSRGSVRVSAHGGSQWVYVRAQDKTSVSRVSSSRVSTPRSRGAVAMSPLSPSGAIALTHRPRLSTSRTRLSPPVWQALYPPHNHHTLFDYDVPFMKHTYNTSVQGGAGGSAIKVWRRARTYAAPIADRPIRGVARGV